MRVLFHKTFDKQYKKLRPNEKQKARDRIKLFTQEPFQTVLNNHPLKGRYQGYHSINITGDLRAVYELITEDTAYFVAIDTHSNLYS